MSEEALKVIEFYKDKDVVISISRIQIDLCWSFPKAVRALEELNNEGLLEVVETYKSFNTYKLNQK